MPESKLRKDAATKRREAGRAELAAQRRSRARLAATGDRSWVPWVFVPVGLLGVAWLVTYYIAGLQIPFMRDLGDWNVAIGLVLMAASFGLATLWK